MVEEYLDIVNKNNNYLGEIKPRSLVHSTGLWHRTVHIYFFRKVDNIIEFLVHLRAKTKDLHPNCWDTRFGGHVKSEEDVKHTVVNEIKNEVGLDVNLDDLIEGDWIKHHKHPNNEFNKVYYFEFKGNIRDLKFDDGEVQKVKWLFADEIEKSMINEPDTWAGKAEDFKKITDSLEVKFKN